MSLGHLAIPQLSHGQGLPLSNHNSQYVFVFERSRKGSDRRVHRQDNIRNRVEHDLIISEAIINSENPPVYSVPNAEKSREKDKTLCGETLWSESVIPLK